MRYVVKWLKDGKSHEMVTTQTTPGGALNIAWALLDARPSDIWIETERGRLVASYADIVDEGPVFATAMAHAGIEAEFAAPDTTLRS